MSTNIPLPSPQLSPLRPPAVRHLSVVSSSNFLQSDPRLHEASSCSFAQIARGAAALVNLPPPLLPPKDEEPLPPGVSGHAILLGGKFKPLSNPLDADSDVYLVTPTGMVSGRTQYKITPEKDTVSDKVYLYDAILDELVESSQPRRVPTGAKKPSAGTVGRSYSVPLRKNRGTRRGVLDHTGAGNDSSWLHIDVHKPIPIVENGLSPPVSSKFTEGPLSPSAPAAQRPAVVTTSPATNEKNNLANNSLYGSPIQQLLLPPPTHVIGLTLTTGYSPAISRTKRIEIPVDDPSFTDAQLFRLLRREQAKLSGFFKTRFSLRGIRSLRLVEISGAPRNLVFSLTFSQTGLLACYLRPPTLELGRSWTDWLVKATTDEEALTLDFVEGWLPQRILLAAIIPLAVTAIGTTVWVLLGPERVFFSGFLFGLLLLAVQSVVVGLLAMLSFIT